MLTERRRRRRRRKGLGVNGGGGGGGGGGVERAMGDEFGAFEDVFVVGDRGDEIVVRQILPYVSAPIPSVK